MDSCWNGSAVIGCRRHGIRNCDLPLLPQHSLVALPLALPLFSVYRAKHYRDVPPPNRVYAA